MANISNKQQLGEVLTKIKLNAIANHCFNTAWCIELALDCLGWEIHSLNTTNSEEAVDMFMKNKIIQKIEKDKGVKILSI